MARSQHTFAKRQRELAKKKKADEKRARRQGKNTGASEEAPEGTAENEGTADNEGTAENDTGAADTAGDQIG